MTRVDIPGFEQKLEVLGRHCADVGRDPNTIRRSLMIPMVIGRDRAEVARRIAAARAIFPALPADEDGVARGQLPRRLGLGHRRRARPVGRGGDGARAAADDGPGGHRRARELRARRAAEPLAELVMFSALLTADGLIALVTLTAMEIVLGIDNVVFLAILVGRLPADQQPLARRLGLSLALGIRIGLLLAISWIMGLTAPFFSVLGRRRLGAGPHPARRRPLPDREGHLGDLRQGRGRPRRGRGGARRAGRSCSC